MSDDDDILRGCHKVSERVRDLLVVAPDSRRVLVRVQDNDTPAPGVALLEKRQHAAPVQALLL